MHQEGCEVVSLTQRGVQAAPAAAHVVQQDAWRRTAEANVLALRVGRAKPVVVERMACLVSGLGVECGAEGGIVRTERVKARARRVR